MGDCNEKREDSPFSLLKRLAVYRDVFHWDTWSLLSLLQTIVDIIFFFGRITFHGCVGAFISHGFSIFWKSEFCEGISSGELSPVVKICITSPLLLACFLLSSLAISDHAFWRVADEEERGSR